MTNLLYSAKHYQTKCAETLNSVINYANIATEILNDAKNTAKSAAFGNIGDIKYTVRTDTPNGGEWCDGSEYTQSKYPDVYKMLTDGKLQYVDIATYNNVVELNDSCGLFGLDTANNSFKVPLLKDVYIKSGQVADEFGAESLPNITGRVGSQNDHLQLSDGAFYTKEDSTKKATFSGESTSFPMSYFDASLSSSTYQDGAKVNPDHVKYRAYVILYSDIDIKSDTSREYQLNNPFSLFDVKWSDHELNNASWVASKGSYLSGTVYKSAYTELVTEYNKGTEQTNGDIVYKLTPKGYKIALIDQNTAIDELYEEEGVAWYYVIDTANNNFKLPRTKYGFVGVRDAAGSFVDESLPNITGGFDLGDRRTHINNSSGAFYRATAPSDIWGGQSGASGNTYGIGFDASKVSDAYQDNAPVQQKATEMLLYFYVGDTIQDASIVNVGKLSEQINNVSITVENSFSKLLQVVEYYQATEAWYRLWSDGTLEQGGRCWVGDVGSNGSVNFLKPYSHVPMACVSKSEYGSFSESSGCIHNITATNITMGLRWGGDNSRGGRYCSFYAIGKAAK